MPGDVVRRIVPGQQTQKGYCREVHVSADLNVKGTACMLRNVSADRLRSLQATVRDNAVCLDSWVGSSKVVDLKLVLRTPCGSLLELRPDQEYTRLCDADALNRKGFFANAAFYVGQTLVGTAHVLERESVKWLDEFGLREVRNTKGKIPVNVEWGNEERTFVFASRSVFNLKYLSVAYTQNVSSPLSTLRSKVLWCSGNARRSAALATPMSWSL